MATDIPELNRTPDKSAPEISPAERFFTMTNGGKLPELTHAQAYKQQEDFVKKTRANIAARKEVEHAAFRALPIEERLKPETANPLAGMSLHEADEAIRKYINKLCR